MKILYVASAGTSDATKASIPFHLAANGSAEIGQEAEILLVGDAAEIICGDNASTTHGVGIPPMAELLAKVKEHAIPVYV